MIAAIERPKPRPTCSQRLLAWLSPGHLQPRQWFHPDQAAPRRELSGGVRPEEGGMMGPVIALTMAGAASAHQAATATRKETSRQRAGRRQRTSADPQRVHQGGTAAAAAAPAALDSLSRLQQLADASPQVAQLRRLQALADARFAPVAQLAGGPEEEEPVQGQFATAELQPQLQQAPRANNTGLPDQLKSGIESLSGLSMDDVRVHYNSTQPAQLNALAYAQGSDIHIAPGQERHLPHEAWHVVQQAQGRVKPTMQMKDGVPVNDDKGLEHEADVMGAKALVDAGELRVMQEAQEGVQDTFAPVQRMEWEHRAHLMQSYTRASTQSESTNISSHPVLRAIKNATASTAATPIQRRVGFEFEMGDIRTQHWGLRAGWHDHTKGYVMSTLQGYKLTADEGVGNSQLEVIIDPIDETNPVAVNNLINVTAPAVVTTINNIAQGTYNVWKPANQIAGVNGSSWDRYKSYTKDADVIMGQLQITAGIDMNKLHAHVSGQQATNYFATLNPNADQDDARALAILNTYTNGVIAAHATNATNSIPALGALTQPQRNQIAAIAALMATFPINMRTGRALPYPKAASGPILARTDFSRIMMTLPDAAKNALTPAIMQQIVLATINMVPLIPPVVGADPVIPLGANLQNNPPALNQLSIDNWVAGIVPTRGMVWGHWQGKDLLTRRNFPGNAQQREQIESMGGYGNRVDAGNKPIMEFRSLGGVFVPELPVQLARLVAFLNH